MCAWVCVSFLHRRHLTKRYKFDGYTQRLEMQVPARREIGRELFIVSCIQECLTHTACNTLCNFVSQEIEMLIAHAFSNAVSVVGLHVDLAVHLVGLTEHVILLLLFKVNTIPICL